LLVELCEECSLLDSPSGESPFEFEDDDECSLLVVAGAIGAGATTTGAGATTTGAPYATVGGDDESVVVSLDRELEVSVESADATETHPNSIAIPKDKAAVFNECLTDKVSSSSLDDKFYRYSMIVFGQVTRKFAVLTAVSVL
jgi:hypothetical protein